MTIQDRVLRTDSLMAGREWGEQRAKSVVRWGVGHALPRQAMRAAARRGDLQARLSAEAADMLPQEISEIFDGIRARGPVVSGKFAFVTVDHDVVKQILTSNDFRTGFVPPDESPLTRVSKWAKRDGMHPVEPPSLLVTEAPDHTRYRKLVSKVFTARAVAGLRVRTQEITDELVADLRRTAQAGETVDLVAKYCSQLPLSVIAEILGVPPEERAHVLEMGTYAAASLDMGVDWATFNAVEGALDEFDEWLIQHIKRVRANPGDDLLSQLVQAGDGDAHLTEDELKSTAGLVLVAGFETTVNLLGNAIRLLHDHSDQLDHVRTHPDVWGNTVDEALRFDPPVLLTARSALRDTEVDGVKVPQHGVVVTVLAGANRDPKVFTDPDNFDVTRENAREHVSFSAGRHFCLGAALARMEGEVGLQTLFDAFDVELLDGARRRPTRILRGFESLPARLTEKSVSS